MEGKKGKKVGVNTSSGAKKVQRIEKESASEPKKTTNGAVKRTVTKKIEEENTKAGARLQAAKARAERKEHRREMREQRAHELQERRMEAKERAAQKRAERKERAAERRAARAARKDMLRNETAIQRLERKEREKQERAALRKQNAELRHELAIRKKEERMHKRKLAAENRKHKREQNTKRRANRTPGFGGWLAAVISLGVASLAMLTLIVIGSMNINGMADMVGSSYRSNLYEMTELSENLDSNLNKLRVASGVGEQRKLLTDILVESELMESALERFPVDMATTTNIASFVNRTSEYARERLDNASSDARGKTDDETLEYVYQTNAALLKELHALRNGMTERDWTKLVKNSKKGVAQSGFENIDSNVVKTPSTIQDGPFSENKEKVTAKGLLDVPEITASEAEALAKEYFKEYGIEKAEYTGDAVANGLSCFNFTLKDGRGREAFAQLSKAGGKLIMFDSYEKCSANNFSQEECVEIAQKFLTSLGMNNMKAVWLQENGTAANINFVYEQDGVLCYSDMVIVKVCETKGKAIGMEALPYYLNHGERNIEKPVVSENTAAKVLGKLKPATARLALIPYQNGEALTYEFSGNYEGNEYFAYVDAKTGEELQTFTVMNTKQGRLLR